jgi:hypothetical protein
LNGLVQNIWSKIDPEKLGTSKVHEGQPLIHLIQIQEEPNSCGTRGWCVRPHTKVLRLVFLNDTRIESQQFILLKIKEVSADSIPKEGTII